METVFHLLQAWSHSIVTKHKNSFLASVRSDSSIYRFATNWTMVYLSAAQVADDEVTTFQKDTVDFSFHTNFTGITFIYIGTTVLRSASG